MYKSRHEPLGYLPNDTASSHPITDHYPTHLSLNQCPSSLPPIPPTSAKSVPCELGYFHYGVNYIVLCRLWKTMEGRVQGTQPLAILLMPSARGFLIRLF